MRSAAALALVCIAGCGDGGSTPSDASVHGDVTAAVDAGLAEAPALPAEPVIGPCPAGWNDAATESGIAWCDPWPASGASTCEGAEAHLPGTSGCAPIGRACPPGEFPAPDALPAGARVLYVRPGATSGDGSMGAPFGTIVEAVRSATRGTAIALAKGTYDGAVSLDRSLILVGACASETLITMTAGVADTVVTVSTSGVVLRDLRIGETDRAGLAVIGASADVTLEGVAITGVVGTAIGTFTGGRVTGDRVLVRDVAEAPGRGGYAVNATYDGTVTLRHAAIERGTGAGAAVYGHGTLIIEDSVVRDTRHLADGWFGVGMFVREGTLTARRVAVVGNLDTGVLAYEPGTTAELDQLVVADTHAPPASPDFTGRGLGADREATMHATRTVVDGYADLGVIASEAGQLALEDVLVMNGRGTDDTGAAGYGAQAGGGGVLRATRLAIERAAGAGITVEPMSSAELSDVIVRDTRPQTDGIGGLGAHFAPGSTATIARFSVERSRSVGIAVIGPDTLVHLEDLTVRDTEAVERYVDASGFEYMGILGRGLTVDVGGTVTIARGRIENSREAGVLVQQGSVAHLSDLVVDGVRERACAAAGCADNPAGTGMVVTDRAAVDLTRFEVVDTDMCGVQVAHFGELDLHDGLVARHPIGACIQVDGYDVGRLMDGVVYRDNETNLDTTMLPLPEVGGF